MLPTERINRRNFLGRVAGTVGGLALAGAWPAPVRARPSPAERITLGIIGAGGIANVHLGPLLAEPDVQVVAACDVQRSRREAMVNAVNQFYGGQACRDYLDYRELIARADIDAVLIATPDHWHALQVIAAARAGKHIYAEKPFSRTIVEGRAMCDAVRRHGIVFQHGTQQKSDGLFRFAAELARSGRLGELHTVRVAVPGNAQGPRVRSGQPPDDIDYDFWIGPAPWSPYSPERVVTPYWYHIEDYSAGGFISAWGVHHIDSAQWGMGTDLTGPVEIEGTGVFPQEGLCDTPLTWHVEYHFGKGPRVIFTSDNEQRFGVTFEGSEGTVFVNRGEFSAQPEALAREPIRPDEISLYRSDNHHRNWLDCIRSGRETVAPAEVGQRSQTICTLSDIAIRVGRKLSWDADTETVVGDEEASRLLSRALREPWSL